MEREEKNQNQKIKTRFHHLFSFAPQKNQYHGARLVPPRPRRCRGRSSGAPPRLQAVQVSENLETKRGPRNNHSSRSAASSAAVAFFWPPLLTPQPRPPPTSPPPPKRKKKTQPPLLRLRLLRPPGAAPWLQGQAHRPPAPLRDPQEARDGPPAVGGARERRRPEGPAVWRRGAVRSSVPGRGDEGGRGEEYPGAADVPGPWGAGREGRGREGDPAVGRRRERRRGRRRRRRKFFSCERRRREGNDAGAGHGRRGSGSGSGSGSASAGVRPRQRRRVHSRGSRRDLAPGQADVPGE